MTAGFIASQRTDHGVAHAVSCRALGIAPSTFYRHRNRPVTAQQLRRQATDAEVKKAFDESQGTYGSPRVRAQLRREGLSVSKTTVEASMVRQGLCARPKRRYRGLTGQNPGAAAPSDLLRRDFSAQAINQKWRNLWRIEHGWPSVDSWNQTNYNLSHNRLKEDWHDTCSVTYTGVWYVYGVTCRGQSTLAWEALRAGTSVEGYSSNVGDVGYVQP